MKTKKIDRSELFEQHKGLIYGIARKFLGRGMDLEELFLIGFVGFLKAVNGFDESFNTKFSTYAVPYIAGEIKRSFRDGGQIKVSRLTKSLYIKICRQKDKFIKEYGTEPTVNQLAESLGEKKEDIAQAILAATPVSSIYDDEGKINPAVLKIEAVTQENICEKLSLSQALLNMPANLYDVIEKRYFKHMTQAQVAGLIGTNQVQVSRLEKKALAFLRNELG